jgi:hypothetical protein
VASGIVQRVSLGELAIAGADRAGDFEHRGMVAAERFGVRADFVREPLHFRGIIVGAQELALGLVEAGLEREAFAIGEEVAGLVRRRDGGAFEEHALDLRRVVAGGDGRGEDSDCKKC